MYDLLKYINFLIIRQADFYLGGGSVRPGQIVQVGGQTGQVRPGQIVQVGGQTGQVRPGQIVQVGAAGGHQIVVSQE